MFNVHHVPRTGVTSQLHSNSKTTLSKWKHEFKSNCIEWLSTIHKPHKNSFNNTEKKWNALSSMGESASFSSGPI